MDLYASITSMSMSISSANLTNSIQTQVAAMSLDQIQQAGDAITNLLENSVTPELGGNIDVSV